MEEALVREGERVQRLRDEHESIERQTKALVEQEQQLMARRETELTMYVEHLDRGARQMHHAVSKTVEGRLAPHTCAWPVSSRHSCCPSFLSPRFAARLAMSSVSKEPELIPEVRMLLASFEELLSKLVQADAFEMLRLGTNLHGFDDAMRHYDHIMRRLNLPQVTC